MIKGVNKQVVEVVDTGSDYFERALFFVDPKYYGISESKLKEKAGLIANSAGKPPENKKIRRNGRIKKAVCLFAAAAAGSLATVLINFII